MTPASMNQGPGPSFSVLNPDQVTEIHLAALAILEKTGCRVDSAPARRVLASAGAQVEGDMVRVSSGLVSDCLKATPKGFRLYGRDDRQPLDVSGRNVYFGNSWASPHTLDVRTQDIRPTVINDIVRGARVAARLANMDFTAAMGSARDVPVMAAELHEFEAVVSNSAKPVCFIANSVKGLEFIYEMAAEVAGGRDRLRERPFLIPYPQPISPLVFPEKTVGMIMLSARLGLPTMCSPSAMAGATSPVTLAGTLALTNAESLMGLVIAQSVNPGTPFLLGGTPSVIDMNNGAMCMAAPEQSLMISAFGDIARFYNLPTWGTAGCSEAKVLDQEAGIEAAMGLITQSLGGCNLIHDIGYMDMGMANSLEMLVMGDEIAGMVRRFLRGIAVNADTLALEVIDRVGPGGNFLQERHTLDNFRHELWFPSLMARQPVEQWRAKGRPAMGDLIRDRISDLLAQPVADPLPASTIEQLNRIKAEGEKALAAE